MKRLFLMILAIALALGMAATAAGCGSTEAPSVQQGVEPDSGYGVDLYGHWLAEDFGEAYQPGPGGGISDSEGRQLIMYDAYYQGPGEWLLFGVTITAEGCQCRLFGLQGEELQSLCRWPEEDYFSMDDWGFLSFYLAEPGLCAMYNQNQQQFCFYDVAAGSSQVVRLPESLALAEGDTAICLTDKQFLLSRRLPDRCLSLSLYDLTTDEEQPLLQAAGGRVQSCVQPNPEERPGHWLLLTNGGDLLELQLRDTATAQVQALGSCQELWPPEQEPFYNGMQLIPGTEGRRILLSVSCEENMVYQAIDWVAGQELGRCAIPQKVEEAGQRIANDVELLGAYGDKMFFPEYTYNEQKHSNDLRLLARDYLTGEEQEIFNNLKQPQPRYGYYWRGFASPEGDQLLLLSRYYLWLLPLAD